MTMTTIDVATIEPLTHDEAMRRQAHELERTLALLRSLDEAAWTLPDRLPCVGRPCHVPARTWRVRVGRVHAGERPPAAPGPGSTARQNGGPLEAALSAVQVRDRADLSPAQVVERLAAVAPRTVRGRTRTPAVVRTHARLAVDGPVHETWKLGYLIDTIYLRDLWMHRVDAARALKRPLELSCRPRRPDRRRHRRRMGAPPRQALRARPRRLRRRYLRP